MLTVLRPAEPFSLRVRLHRPVPNTPNHGTIKSYRELSRSRALKRYQMIELFGLLQVGHAKMDHFLLPIVVGDECHGRIPPIPVKGPAIQAGRMVVHFRGRAARTRGSRSELRRLA